MQVPKAILIGSIIIGGCVLTHLGYTIWRDRSVVEAARHDRERQAKAVAENERRVQSKEVWKMCLKSMDWKFDTWIDTQIPHKKDSHLFFPWMFLKGFDLSDIEWRDAHHITVRGFLAASSKDGLERDQQYFSWTRTAELRSDGVDSWWAVGDPAFQKAILTKDQHEHMLMFAIVQPTSEHPLGESSDAVK
jgi:hypothetical protein